MVYSVVVFNVYIVEVFRNVVDVSILAAIDDAGEFLQHGHVVGRHHHGCASLADGFEQAHDVASRFWVKVTRRFIGND